MKIILAAVDYLLVEAWRQVARKHNFVQVHEGSILDLKVSAAVSPANSFGFMDGGIDRTYVQHFGRHIQDRLQALIREKHHGELLVGAAEIVTTDDLSIPYLIAAPTMRVPMILRNSVGPYLAARAALLLVKHGAFADGPLVGQRVYSSVTSVAIPGLGTGVGRVPPDVCARQVDKAIHDVLGSGRFPKTWLEAQREHQRLYGAPLTKPIDLQFEGDDYVPD